MSQASHLQSAAIAGYDASPATKPAGGAGGYGFLEEVSGTVTTVTADTTSSTYQLVRVRSDCYVKNVILDCGAMSTSAALNIGVWYSDNTADFPTNPSLPGTVINATLFASAVSVSSAVRASDVTNQSGNYTIDLRLEPLWQAAGLNSDPGGYFDIVAQPSSAITAGALLGVSVRFCTV